MTNSVENKNMMVEDSNNQEQEVQESRVQVSNHSKTIGWVMDEVKVKNFNFSLCIQRNEVWDLERKSLLIHSLLQNFPVPPIMTQIDVQGNVHVLDGKQRVTSIGRFIAGEYALSVNTPPFNGVEIAGKKYEELPESFKRKIQNFNLVFYSIFGMNDAERDEVFQRLNNQSPLTKIELLRAYANGTVMRSINEIAAHPFFDTKVKIDDKSKNRFLHHELIFQVLIYMMDKKDLGFGGDDIRKLTTELKKNDGVPQETKERMLKVATYLDEAFPPNFKDLKKTHASAIFKLADEMMDKVTPKEFFYTIKVFFKNKKTGDSYSKLCASGSAKRERVWERLEIMEDKFTKYLPLAKEIIAKEEKEAAEGKVTTNQNSIESEAKVLKIANQAADNNEKQEDNKEPEKITLNNKDKEAEKTDEKPDDTNENQADNKEPEKQEEKPADTKGKGKGKGKVKEEAKEEVAAAKNNSNVEFSTEINADDIIPENLPENANEYQMSM